MSHYNEVINTSYTTRAGTKECQKHARCTVTGWHAVACHITKNRQQ
jgi:hypothetical protein